MTRGLMLLLVLLRLVFMPFHAIAVAAAAAAATAVTTVATYAAATDVVAEIDRAVLSGDAIREARCFAKCYRQIASEKPKCYSGCLNDPWIKPGECPVGDLGDVVSLDRPCLKLCDSDDFCYAEYKCCTHNCGITCQPPVGLADSSGLPDKPNIVNVSDYGKSLVVEWSVPETSISVAGHVTYLLQERHHVGVEYVPERLTEWVTVTRTDRTREQSKSLYAPGRWFEFRVAAINENGTKGYSRPYKPFFVDPGLYIDPPGMPEKLMVTSLKWTNREFQQCMLSWTPPASSVLPVRRYKVFISERVGNHVYHKRRVVPADILRFPIKKLNSNSEYFLQVQAISEFGRKRFAGPKASTTLKTKGKKNFNVKHLQDKKIYGLKIVTVNNVDSSKSNLINARISWRPVSMTSKKFLYIVSWIPKDCTDNSDEIRVKIRMAYFDLRSLNSQCKYLITVSTSHKGARYEGSFVFSTPTELH